MTEAMKYFKTCNKTVECSRQGWTHFHSPTALGLSM